MNWLKKTYNLAFAGFVVSVVIIFFYLRPFNSPWDRLINGDGLGYYSYLPARYIHNDPNFDFKWFNKVFKQHYAQSSFANPEDNFMVTYRDKRINKYYPGLSFAWIPFFGAAHIYAKTFHYPSDGFSEPYQWAIGLASLFYLLLGLFYLRRLMEKLFHNPFVALIVPIVMFFGTALFVTSIRYNSLSHVYSFTFITLFLNSLVSYFNETNYRLRNFLLAILWFSIVVSIRPFNGLVILLLPAFFPNGFFKERLRFENIKTRDLGIMALVVAAIWYQLRINYSQTSSVLPFTYSGESFHFDRSHFFEALIGYRIGIFVYMPLVFISFFGIPWLSSRRRFILPLFFLGILFIYSSWWYWPIVKRTMIDFYIIPAVLLGALANRFYSKKWRMALLTLLSFCVIYYQLKNYQISNGILDEYYTYKEVFWRNFFRIKKTNMYLVPPESILKQSSVTENFEDGDFPVPTIQSEKFSGNCSLALDSVHYISRLMEARLPSLLNGSGFKKIKVSFRVKATGGANKLHFFLKLAGKNDSLHYDLPFYFENESLLRGEWDYKELGVDLADIPGFNLSAVNKITCSAWNVEAKGIIYIDELKIDFMLTDPGFEIVN
ncbi:MAG: hypothetical protein JNL60_14490 [Bacteroidia bacterium]|nr:hypothetical protein [Bacteroidia bacterium]